MKLTWNFQDLQYISIYCIPTEVCDSFALSRAILAFVATRWKLHVLFVGEATPQVRMDVLALFVICIPVFILFFFSEISVRQVTWFTGSFSKGPSHQPKHEFLSHQWNDIMFAKPMDFYWLILTCIIIVGFTMTSPQKKSDRYFDVINLTIDVCGGFMGFHGETDDNIDTNMCWLPSGSVVPLINQETSPSALILGQFRNSKWLQFQPMSWSSSSSTNNLQSHNEI